MNERFKKAEQEWQAQDHECRLNFMEAIANMLKTQGPRFTRRYFEQAVIAVLKEWPHIKQAWDKWEKTELVSSCCSGPVNTDTLICGRCGEHCEAVETE